jgi:tetratricopeptide (TPR) repeat protein
MTSAPSDEHARLDGLASDQMKRGIALLNEGAPEALQEAVRCFDEAIELRRRLPLTESPGFRYGLAGGLINRGDALKRLGGAEYLAEAVSSYATAVELLKDLPADDDGSFVRRLAIALIHRGIALEEQEREPARAEAVDCYKEAVQLLRRTKRNADGKLDMVLASALVNLGNASLRLAGRTVAPEACADAEQALSLLKESESKEPWAAEAGLRARHILCQAMILSLEESPAGAPVEPELIGKLTDTLEGALSLAQCWEKAGFTGFRPLATHFFHWGAVAYEKYQPQFLGEFLLEHLAPEWAAPFPTWFTIAQESLSRVRNGLRNCDFASLTTPEGVRRLETLKEVQAAEEKLETLRSACAPGIC